MTSANFFIPLLILSSINAYCYAKLLSVNLNVAGLEKFSQDVDRVVKYDVILSEMPPVRCDFILTLSTRTIEPKPKIVTEVEEGGTFSFNSDAFAANSNSSLQRTFKISSKFFGYYEIDGVIQETCKGSPPETYSQTWHDLKVTRQLDGWDIFVNVLLAILISINHVNMGCQLDISVIKNTLRKPIGPAIGFVCQFVVMPLIAFLFGFIFFRDDATWRFAIFVLGCSPGGSASNFWTLIFDGDLNLSVTMTLISSIAALAFMPFWLFTLGSVLLQGNIAVPFANLIGSMVAFTLPLLCGLLIKQYRPEWAKVTARYVKPATIAIVVVTLLATSIVYSFIFLLFTWSMFISGIGVALAGYGSGALGAYLCKLPKDQIIAVSIEVAFQNAGIAFILLLFSLPAPASDIAGVPVVAQLLATSIPLWFLLVGQKIYSRFWASGEDQSRTLIKLSDEVDASSSQTASA